MSLIYNIKHLVYIIMIYIRYIRLSGERCDLFMRFFTFVVLFLYALHAETVVNIDSSHVSLDDFKIDYFIDDSEKMSIEEVMKQKFTEGPNNLSLGTEADVTWVKINLLNRTKNPQKLFIHNAMAFHSEEIQFYEVVDHTVVNKMIISPRYDINTDDMDGAEILYAVDIEAGQGKSIYMKSYFLAYQLIELSIHDERSSREDLVHRYVPIVILFSILMTLALYYLILYISARYKEYIFYALYLLIASIFLAYCYGMLSHYYHIYGAWGLRLTALVIIAPVFLAMFVKVIFNTKERYVLQDKFINSIIVIFTLIYIYSFFYYYQAIEFISLVFVYFLIVMLWVSISLHKLKAPLIGYFFIAHIFNLFFTLVAILFYNDVIAYNFFTSHAMAIGTMFEALMLAFLVSYRIRLLEVRNKKNEKLILVDPMTSLYNKSYFDVILKREILVHRREKTNLTLIIIDIDYFKQYNDTYGHPVGDKTLIRVAKALKRSLKRPTDMAFRIGGEEFAIICSDMKKTIAYTFSDKLRLAIGALNIEHKTSGVEDHLTVSIGVCTVPKHYLTDAEQIYRHADNALYEAKLNGRNLVVVYEN